ncbi:PEP-CTERM sorting domain-containing protein [Massilia soli]|uniref:PEP-CTERM sorting domain-containing protein n=1 Tax=Massilia soli TaxID=2792854 RepID=A0ABS7SJL6_9BURK|nr:PEP-CTERM sorting domain-containing protein [Massilia soli]MBZ2206309.1 hypothetical protein [Massilia soli]
MIQTARHFAAAAVLCLMALPAAATPINIVRNPGFEQGTAFWNSAFFVIGNDPLWAHTDPGMARTSCTGLHCVDSLMSGAYISQLLPTVAGAEYDLSFWIRSFKGKGQYSVFWDGVLLDDILLAANGPMSQATFSGLYASANATLLEIHGRNDAHSISFDDFNVVTAKLSDIPASVPPPDQVFQVNEPATFALVLAGLALAGLSRRR